MQEQARPITFDELHADLMRWKLRAPGSALRLEQEEELSCKVLRLLQEQVGCNWSAEERDSLLLPFLLALRDGRVTFLSRKWFANALRNYRSENWTNVRSLSGPDGELLFEPAEQGKAPEALDSVDFPVLREALEPEQKLLLGWVLENGLDRGWAKRAAADLGWNEQKPYRVFYALCKLARRYHERE
jgi:hypothetical protein